MDVDINQTAVVTRVEESGLGRRLGVAAGDVVLTVNDVVPRDILEWQRLVDEDTITLRVSRRGEELTLTSERVPGEATGITIESAVFDRVHTCDNHCEFCFIYQLPKGMRRSLYLKDDDYRLSFLFGNFTTLTRFTEADLERVIDEGLSPLFVSIHATDPWRRAEMLRNPRGGTSLRWLSQLIDRGIEVNGQIVLCPGVNDGDVLDGTLLGILEQFPGLARVAVVPLGISKENTERRMRAMTVAEALALIEQVDRWRAIFAGALGRPMVYLADEVYLTAGRSLPERGYYDGFGMLEDGIGMARCFVEEFDAGEQIVGEDDRAGFFATVDVTSPTDYQRSPGREFSTCGTDNPARDTGLRVSRTTPVTVRTTRAPSRVVILTGECAAPILAGAVAAWNAGRRDPVEVHAVDNEFFGGTTSVAGLLTGTDLRRVMDRLDDGGTLFLLPDSCLNDGTFLDGTTLNDLATRHRVEAVPARGHHLRARLEAHGGRGTVAR